jgi:hypothetical protein
MALAEGLVVIRNLQQPLGFKILLQMKHFVSKFVTVQFISCNKVDALRTIFSESETCNEKKKLHCIGPSALMNQEFPLFQTRTQIPLI